MFKILFIITGSIAASKCIDIFESLDLKRFQISCILTKEAEKYIKIRDLKKYTKNRIFTDLSESKNKMLHINLSRINDIIYVCPISANSIAKFANGYGNNLASNTLLATNKKVFLVPAMNSQMWLNKSNQRNIKILNDMGHEFIGPDIGNLKCGEFGIGRISKTQKIVDSINSNFKIIKYFRKKRCLVTAGPTIEMIDPVRFISNQSSGKQGYEIAAQLALNDAKVTLISGPTNLHPPSGVKLIKINSADEMYNEIKKINNLDIAFFAAAVSDFKSKKLMKEKFKKRQFFNLNLKKNIDILEVIGNDKTKRPKLLVGFAAETGNVSLAKIKLRKKKL